MQARANGWLCGLAALALVSTAAACRGDSDRQGSAAANRPPAEQSQRAANDNPDWWTTTKVQAKFFADDLVKARKIDVTTKEGVVTLNGTVESPAAKERAVALARQIDGVASVNDQLRVQQASAAAADRTGAVATTGTVGNRIDAAWITTKIQAQYYADPALKPWNIDVTTVGEGSVTLSGEVDNAASRDKAVAIARSTDGVTAVNDRLRIKGATATSEPSGPATPAGMLPDAWITAKIQSKYFMDGDVKGSDIDVTTQDGVVTLQGTARSDAEHRQAVALARGTDGVKDVRDNLQVQPKAGAAAGPLPAVAGSDAWITTKIQSKYFMDPAVKATDVNVDTADGVVTLTGQVPDSAARQTAETIARETTGVKRVVNNLQVGSR